MKKDRVLNMLEQIEESYILEAVPKKITMEMEKKEIKANKIITFLKRPMVAAAALALCVCLTGTTALAATGVLQGFFNNVLGINGAVVGTIYEQASDEVALKTVEVAEQLMVELTILYPDKVPYREIEVFGIERCKIVDENNSVIAEGITPGMTEVSDGAVVIGIPLAQVPDGTYKLIVSELAGWKKADRKLILKGSWECEFIK